MNWLRPILLLASALFIGLIIWWERRRSRSAQNGGVARVERSERNEPSFEAGAGDLPRAHAQPGAPNGSRDEPVDGGSFIVAPQPNEAPLRDRELRRPPPVIDWSDAEISVSADPPVAGPAPSAVVPPEDLAADQPALVLDWPDETERRIVSLRILPARQDRLAGRALRQGLAGCGFRHGPLGIFHLPEADGRVILSAASLVRPGTLDPQTMDFQRFAGINLFAVLPGPLRPDLTLDRLAAVAAELADRIAGRVQDESGAPFNGARLAEWRDRALATVSADPGATAAGHAAGPGAAATAEGSSPSLGQAD